MQTFNPSITLTSLAGSQVPAAKGTHGQTSFYSCQTNKKRRVKPWNAEISKTPFQRPHTILSINFTAETRRRNPSHKPPAQIQSSRLETITARRIDLRRPVSRLVGASYAIHEAQLRQFQQATLFEMRRRAIARTYCRIGNYGVQIQLPLSAFVSLVRVLNRGVCKITFPPLAHPRSHENNHSNSPGSLPAAVQPAVIWLRVLA